jgi:FMN phosphatase YigB (HAD superfamily)
LGLTEQFEEIYTGDQYKNKGEMFQMLASRYNPNNMKSVGDQEKTDIEPAKKLGIAGILIRTPKDIWNIMEEIV